MGMMAEALHRAHNARTPHLSRRSQVGAGEARPATISPETGPPGLPSETVQSTQKRLGREPGEQPSEQPPEQPGAFCLLPGQRRRMAPPHFQSIQQGQRGLEEYFELIERMGQQLNLTRARSIGLTGVCPRKIKTGVAVNLAFALAQTKRHRVLLIDGDIEQPGVSERLELPASRGLSDVLLTGLAPAKAIHSSAMAGYAVLGAGARLRGATEQIGSRRMVTLLAEFKRTYDLILLAAPTGRHAADAQALSQCCDAVLVVAEMFRTPRRRVITALDKLREAGIRVRGCILASGQPE